MLGGMMSSEDFEDLDGRLHQKMIQGDADAPSQLFVKFSQPIINYLKSSYPNINDEDLICDAVTEAMQNYRKNPTSYQPNKRKSLLNFLKMSAKGDLMNRLDKEKRRRNKEREATENLQQEISQNEKNLLDILEERYESEQLEAILQKEFSNPIDWQLYQLIYRQQERATSSYTKLLSIEHETELEQKRIVKRHKDRIKKKFNRLCQKMGEKS